MRRIQIGTISIHMHRCRIAAAAKGTTPATIGFAFAVPRRALTSTTGGTDDKESNASVRAFIGGIVVLPDLPVTALQRLQLCQTPRFRCFLILEHSRRKHGHIIPIQIKHRCGATTPAFRFHRPAGGWCRNSGRGHGDQLVDCRNSSRDGNPCTTIKAAVQGNQKGVR